MPMGPPLRSARSALRAPPARRGLTLTQTYAVVTVEEVNSHYAPFSRTWHCCRIALNVRFVLSWVMTVERAVHLIGHLEGRRVSLSLADGSRIDDCELV